MAKYVNGFVLPVLKKNVETYRKMAREAGKAWREHGALEFVECVADDVKPGILTFFPRSVKREPEETVVFPWIVYAFREDRDRISERVMKDPRIANLDPQPMPFDSKRRF